MVLVQHPAREATFTHALLFLYHCRNLPLEDVASLLFEIAIVLLVFQLSQLVKLLLALLLQLLENVFCQ